MRRGLSRLSVRALAAAAHLHFAITLTLPAPARVSGAPRTLLLGLFCLACPALVSAQIPLEAEEAQVVVNVGGAPCDTVECSFASNGAVIAGVDTLGDYLEWEITEDFLSYLNFGLRSASTAGQIRKYQVSVRTQEGLLAASLDTLTTPPGSGVG